jgi:hypothetical protein
VPNWGFSGPYPTDFIGTRFWAKSIDVVGKKSLEINSQILKTALLTFIARPGRKVPE